MIYSSDTNSPNNIKALMQNETFKLNVVKEGEDVIGGLHINKKEERMSEEGYIRK